MNGVEARVSYFWKLEQGSGQELQVVHRCSNISKNRQNRAPYTVILVTLLRCKGFLYMLLSFEIMSSLFVSQLKMQHVILYLINVLLNW